MTDLNSSFFNVTREGAVAVLEMNRPDKANCMSPDFWADLPRLAAGLDSDSNVRCVVLTGAGKHFSGGMDLATFADINTMLQQEPGRAAYALRDLILRLQGSLSSLEKLRVPVIAAVHGACLGGGIDLITACDLRIASRDASFGIEEIHIGMAADVGTLQRLPKLIPPAVVHELAYTGRRFSPDEALGWGLLSSVHDDREAMLDAAMELAQNIAEKSPLAIAGIKRAITYSRDHSVEDALDQMATWNAGMLRPEDLQKAISAKTRKQEAVFSDLLSTSL
ncbi:MAG: crotonase/enoyl-CoA hydratase family protein [Rhizobiaceae bacterium]|nr:crotonase/enoyl-CoA hydratase family protein [Rhizobiaceae bacterium]